MTSILYTLLSIFISLTAQFDFLLRTSVNNLFDVVKLNSNHDDENHLKTHEPFKLAYNIINSANDVVIICEAEPIDEPGPRIVYVNDNFVRTTGYSVEEVVGKTPRILQGPETNLITLGRMHDALKNWQPICVDVLNYKKNGEAFWVSISIFPVANENGWFTHWVSIQRSIKDNKQHEAELLSSKAKLLTSNQELIFQNEEKASRAAELLVANKELTFQNNEKAKRTAELLILNAAVNKRDSDLRFILENSPIAILMTSKVNGLLVFVNKRYCDLTGLFPADLIGINPKELYVVEEDYDELSQEQPSDDGMRSKLVKLAFKHKFKWVLTSGIEMEYENEPVSLDWLYEVTEQKKLERTLMDTQKRLNFSFEGSGDGTWDWNTTNGEVIYSRQWKSMLGYSESELKDDFKEWETRVHQDDLAKAVSDIQAYLDGATSRYINEHRLMCKDGNYKWILTRGIITAHNANGEAMRMIGTHTDITPQKDIEHALLIAQSESEQANQAKSRFLAAASHDLRQPLTALTLYVDVLTKRTNGDAAGLGKKIQVCVSSLSGLLDNLLDVSKLEAGVVLPAKSVFKIDDLLSSVVNIHTAEADSKGLRLLLRPTNLVVHTDYTILQRILGNLIVNAISYTNEGGVLVSCRRHNGKQWIEIWDSGVGFPSNMARYIFDEFTQLGDNSRSVGSGLGLAIVSKSANLLGLELRVRSRLGRGSMFAIEIPQGDTLQIVRSSEPKVAVDNWIIALVDDNPMVLDATSFALNVIGHEVIVAESESSIFKNLGYQTPDIFISDYRLADNKTGLELVLKARDIFGEDLPVILITGDTDPKLIKLFTKHKIKVCYKPLKMDILNNLISEVMLPC